MNAFIRILLALLYIAMLPVMVLRRALGLDTLQLRKPGNAKSYWLVRGESANTGVYFSQASNVEGKPAHRVGSDRLTDSHISRWLAPPLLKLARLFAPPKSPTKAASSAADRESGIPDEVYTLW